MNALRHRVNAANCAHVAAMEEVAGRKGCPTGAGYAPSEFARAPSAWSAFEIPRVASLSPTGCIDKGTLAVMSVMLECEDPQVETRLVSESCLEPVRGPLVVPCAVLATIAALRGILPQCIVLLNELRLHTST